ncbi:hypothetical protein VTN00DRAFT_5475 [Thermoascus crustaceus]|uniref:uncharacterized protein n=1 Tax=Thermoascus crustaceus TaxID=5088 RepID=UPI0037426871
MLSQPPSLDRIAMGGSWPAVLCHENISSLRVQFQQTKESKPAYLLQAVQIPVIQSTSKTCIDVVLYKNHPDHVWLQRTLPTGYSKIIHASAAFTDKGSQCCKNGT